jgi:hypothetical protein
MSNKIYIPCGFRCFTNLKLKELKISQPSLPFDWGFFSTQSIIKFLENDIPLTLENTSPCIKTERFQENGATGVKFEESDYNIIDAHIEKQGYDNQYLDRTKGYYTLCKSYNFVLAHYNWHKSSPKYDGGSIEEINSLLQKRKARLFNLIEKAEEVNLCLLHASQFLKINDKTYPTNPELLVDYFQSRFKGKKINYLNLESIQTL